MNFRTPVLFLFLLAMIAGGNTAVANAAGPDPLEAISPAPFDTLLEAPDPPWNQFTAVHVLLPEVAFRRNWQRDQNRYGSIRVRNQDVERIRGDVAELVRDLMQEGFSEAGWRMAETPGQGVLVVRPNIADLDIVAPDVPTTGNQRSYSDRAGSMTLELTVSDGGSGDVLLQATDHAEDPRENFLEWRARPSNYNRVRVMVRRWAEDLTDRLGPPNT